MLPTVREERITKKSKLSKDLRLRTRKRVPMQSNSCVLLILVPIALAKVFEVQKQQIVFSVQYKMLFHGC